MALRLCQIQYGTILVSCNFRQARGECQVKKAFLEKFSMALSSIKVNHAPRGGPKILSSAIRKNGLVPPVLDSLDNYKILSERMNVLTC